MGSAGCEPCRLGLPASRRSGRVNTAIRFDPEVHAALLVAAADREVSLNWLVNRIVREGLTRLRPVGSIFVTDGDSAPPREDDREAANTEQFGSSGTGGQS